MPPTNPLPATDSASELRPILGDDATATFEDDPNFVQSNPGESGSSENVEEQQSAAAGNAISARGTDDTEEEEDDEDEEEDEDDEDEEEDEDLEDDDEDDVEDGDEEDDEEYEDDDDEDEDEDDDEDEVKASSVLRADGLLGYEDEADDVREGVDRKKGDDERAEAEEELKDGEKNYDPYSHEDGKWEPVEKDDTPEAEGALIEDKNDDPDFVPPYRAGQLSAVMGSASFSA